MAKSFVRALPLSQVKSAKANGWAFSGFAVPVAPFSIACGWTPATVADLVTLEDAGSAEVQLEAAGPTPPAPVGAGEELALDGVGAEAAAAGCALPSSSAMRFSSCSTRSKSCRSRPVNGAGASIFTAAGLAGGCCLPSSSANARAHTALAQSAPTSITDTSFFHLKMFILVS